MTLNNKAYDILKWIAQILLPACATLYFALSKVWGLPYSAEITGTISALDIFLGAVLGISSINYLGDGTLQIDESGEDKDVYRLVLNGDPGEFAGQRTISLKVEKTSIN